MVRNGYGAKFIWYEIAILWYEMVNYGTKWLWYDMTFFVIDRFQGKNQQI
jgi:hypothetical protein